jgi:hypothetical protein
MLNFQDPLDCQPCIRSPSRNPGIKAHMHLNLTKYNLMSPERLIAGIVAGP